MANSDIFFPTSPSLRHFPSWQSEYEAVLFLVKSLGSLSRCVQAAETVMLTRRQALERTSDHHGERQAIEAALNNLNRIKRETRKFQGVRP